MIVLDSSATLALIFGETGGSEVDASLGQAVMGAVNLAEVVAGMVRKGHDEEKCRAILVGIDLPVIPADEAVALDAGLLRRFTDSAGLSLGDRFCLALARRLPAPVLTADRAWARIAGAVGVEVRLIR